MNPLQFFFRFTAGQRKGIIALFLLIIIVQVVYFAVSKMDLRTDEQVTREEKQWLTMQGEIDALKATNAKEEKKVYPFNPNFISDYKGYTLGMTTLQIDRLHKFRKEGKWINSAEDFKKVTKIPDSLLNKISAYFKFPDWVTNKRENSYSKLPYAKESKDFENNSINQKEKPVQLDINNALEEDLVKVYGIGPAFAKKILRRRADLGAYVSMAQMQDFKELSPQAISGLNKFFIIGNNPQPNKININSASLKQLTYFPYFNRDIAKAVLTKRSMKGKINSIDELLEINDFPVDKIKIIALYLEF